MVSAGGEEDAEGELAGGFASLDGMLQWAISHSDPVKLKEKASNVQQMSVDELKRRQLEIKELVEKLKVPSDAELMRRAINELNNSSISLEDRQHALDELLVLVEPIDNANDFCKLSGIAAVVRELGSANSKIRLTSAWVLGKASQNNPLVQNQVLSSDALKTLLEMARSGVSEEGVKALYAISSLVRNNDQGLELFIAEQGGLMLQDVMSNPSVDIRLRKKAVLLVADMADRQLENPDSKRPSLFRSCQLLKSVVDLTSSTTDLDLQEKALIAIRSLLQLDSSEILVVLDMFCGLDKALERMKERLKELAVLGEEGDFARDIESLGGEIRTIFRRKLEAVEQPLAPQFC
ncbi:unnamed protein product [Spirodela intermedia]|nr:unnamed protein product [Spirodela intermedia]CAA6668060.1 unnamed protein product [Spirodela intermedia]